VPISGYVVIDTRSGEGLAQIADHSAKLDSAKVESLAVDGAIDLKNDDDAPLVAMVYILEGH
jgi:hypothetical protein